MSKRDRPQTSMLSERINWYYYASIRIQVTQKMNWVSRSALYHLESYINGLIVQWNRMVEDSELYWGLMHADLTANVEAAKAYTQFRDRLGLDIHFYAVCWDKVNKYFRRFAESQEDKQIRSIWGKISGLTEKASGARHFFEHLDKALTERNFGDVTYSLAGHNFYFKYVNVSKKDEKYERELILGRAEVESVMEAYEKVLLHLGADFGGVKGHVRLVNGETKS